MKKVISTTVAITLMSMVSTSYAANTLDLGALDGLVDDTSTETTTATPSGSMSISNIDVMFQDGKSVPSKKNTKLMVVVTDGQGNKLDDTKISVTVDAVADGNPSVGTIGNITYNNEGQYFEVPYVASENQGNIFFNIKATAIDDPTVVLEQGEELTVTAPVPETPTPTTESPTPTTPDVTAPVETPTTETTEISITEDETSTDGEVQEEKDVDLKVEANILSTKIIGDNRIVVNFDRELFLPEEPVSLVSIQDTVENKEVKVANVTLGDDKKSLVVLTTEALGKNPYRLTINEVVDGETKKKIHVVNGELTVTGFNEMLVMLLAFFGLGGFAIYRRRK